MGRRARRGASRQYAESIPIDDVRYESDRHYSWIAFAIGTLIVGALAGYILGTQGNRSTWAPSSAAPVSAASTTPVFDEGALKAHRNILQRDPKNVQTAVNAANVLYDAQRYVEAIPFYQQAFALNPKDINVSTDLGTALWYSGRPDEALAQYDKSLSINPTHAQTLFNIGIVKADGKRDYVGAVGLWQKLLAANPNYPDAAKARTLMADAQNKMLGKL